MNIIYKITICLILIQLLFISNARADDDEYDECCIGQMVNGVPSCSGKIKDANKWYKFVCDDKEIGVINNNSTLVCDECSLKATKRLVILLAVLIPILGLSVCACIGGGIYCCCKHRKEKKSHHNKLLNRY
ncbi:hypothetical protein PPL_10511 [Heterostelium album PN500]|uniref:Uncharacterized protein n=1 Tax=Heterostelium pallidum (strain ATCC 26659 / Pp 5 / PN500) TaxID=670386 RepID=D3BRA5_HETP5|nr:hypothetical protein PPL_10511 [Heterostelium album PN500]EFA75937.1 hypothetical protein PPL_10511 [Heterostelium album PN500]|eukprot:XP_020428071.1 hypothetical protein PPL_10511 [Heterostelium album PN500]